MCASDAGAGKGESIILKYINDFGVVTPLERDICSTYMRCCRYRLLPQPQFPDCRGWCRGTTFDFQKKRLPSTFILLETLSYYITSPRRVYTTRFLGVSLFFLRVSFAAAPILLCKKTVNIAVTIRSLGRRRCRQRCVIFRRSTMANGRLQQLIKQYNIITGTYIPARSKRGNCDRKTCRPFCGGNVPPRRHRIGRPRHNNKNKNTYVLLCRTTSSCHNISFNDDYFVEIIIIIYIITSARAERTQYNNIA